MASVLPSTASCDGQRVEFTSLDPTRDVHAVTGWAIERGARLDALSVSRPTLEDVFLGLADGEQP
jgi:ABC-2 type transport system ATP-binding protein